MWSWAALDRNPHLPGARGAVASGDLLSQDGDYFGPVVGLAARAVALARWREPDSRDAEGQRSFSPRALLNRWATSGQFTMFQNASTQSAFTFRYCR